MRRARHAIFSETLVSSFDVDRNLCRAMRILHEILGSRGLMPNPQSGTVTFDVAKGKYLRSVTVTSTMGPGVRVDTSKAADLTDEAV